MNCHLSHSIKSTLCENFSDDGQTGEGKRQWEQVTGINQGQNQGVLSKEAVIELSPHFGE